MGFIILYLGLQLHFVLTYKKWTLLYENALGFLFKPPEIISFVIMITSCFYLYCLGSRFCTLNRLWKCLPYELIALQRGGWTNSEIAAIVECIRLLHADLCDLLTIFSLGYGPILLIYFSFAFIHALMDMILLTVGSKTSTNILPYIFYLQYIISICIILCLTSWIIDKVYILYAISGVY